MPAEILKFFDTDFKNILANLPRIFDANLTHFLRDGRSMSPPRKLWKNYRNFSRKFLVETGPNWLIS